MSPRSGSSGGGGGGLTSGGGSNLIRIRGERESRQTGWRDVFEFLPNCNFASLLPEFLHEKLWWLWWRWVHMACYYFGWIGREPLWIIPNWESTHPINEFF